MMKHRNFLTMALLGLLFTLLFAAAACADQISPISVDLNRIDLKNGEFRVSLKDVDSVDKHGYISAELYQEEYFSAKDIRKLKAGDTVLVNGRTWTVKKTIPHEYDGMKEYEISVKEDFDGYIVFRPGLKGQYFSVVDDWTPLVPVGEVRIMLPLPDRFEFCLEEPSGEAQTGDMEDMIVYWRRYGDLSAYNTTCVMEKGTLVRLTHSDYPLGPEGDDLYPKEAAAGQPEVKIEGTPVWHFRGGTREGLETAVVTKYYVDCEAGLIQKDVTEEEAEEMRNLAINGMVTGKENDMMTTGGTTLYFFTTPEGQGLMSLELYGKLLVGGDGMYRIYNGR